MKSASLALLPLVVLAQSSFEVASVKPSAPDTVRFGGGRGGPGAVDPGQYMALGVSLKDLLFREAFNLADYEYAAPAWMDNQLYDVAAKVPPGAGRDQFRVMLQNLLVERFQIKLHHEQRAATVYDLTIAKSGLKMQTSPFDDNVPPGHESLQFDADGLPVIPAGAGPIYFGMPLRNQLAGQMVIVTNRGSMAHLIIDLSRNLKVPITNKTGLTGNFVYRLHFLVPGNEPPPEAASDPAPSLFEALKEQLALTLEKRQGTIDVLVIDQAQKVPIKN